MKVTVLGCGRVGRVIVEDLLTLGFDVTVVDSRTIGMGASRATLRVADLSKRSEINRVLFDTNPDIVVSAVPGFLGYQILDAVTTCGGTLVDISFMEANPLSLHLQAQENEAIAVVDCGILPGLNGIMCGAVNQLMDINRFDCLAGGLPKNPKPPWFYKAAFSPADVIELYTRPARMMENGAMVVKDPLSDRELITICGKTLEGANTDGLRTLLDNMRHIPNMREITLRYEGHYDFFEKYRRTGMFKENQREPWLEKRIFDEWQYDPGEKDILIYRALFEGTSHGTPMSIVYDLYDEHDGKRSAMGRCTGYVCTGAVRAIRDGLITQTGVLGPEQIGGMDGVFEFMLEHLKERGVNVSQVVDIETCEGVTV